jgi:hypothetical protein
MGGRGEKIDAEEYYKRKIVEISSIIQDER